MSEEKLKLIGMLDRAVVLFLARWHVTSDQMMLDDVRALANVSAWIMMQPEIVRCYECKHKCGSGQGLYSQFIECGKTGGLHKEDWFCGDGEKEEADELDE